MRAALPRPASGRPRVEEAFDHFRRAGPARRTSPSPRSPPSTRAASSGRWRAARRTRPASRAPSTRRRRSCRWASDDRPPGRPWPWGLAPAPPLGTWSAPASADCRARSHTSPALTTGPGCTHAPPPCTNHAPGVPPTPRMRPPRPTPVGRGWACGATRTEDWPESICVLRFGCVGKRWYQFSLREECFRVLWRARRTHKRANSCKSH